MSTTYKITHAQISDSPRITFAKLLFLKVFDLTLQWGFINMATIK